MTASPPSSPLRSASPSAPSSLLAAARLRVLGLLFERPRAGWADEARALAAELGENELPGLIAVAAGLDDWTEGLYLRWLGPGGWVSPREVGYSPMGDPGKILADLGAYYQAFEFRPDGAEPFDHVAVQTGFLGYLALKTAYAETAGDREGAAVCRSAAESFTAEHLRPLANRMAARLEQLDGPAPLVLGARLLAETTGAEPAPLRTLPILEQAPDPLERVESPCGEGILDGYADHGCSDDAWIVESGPPARDS